jgi:hypothetical protein
MALSLLLSLSLTFLSLLRQGLWKIGNREIDANREAPKMPTSVSREACNKARSVTLH